MAHKRVEFRGFVEVPDAFDVDLGWIVELAKARGEVTSVADKITHKDSGETTITRTLTLTLDATSTKLGKASEPSGPLDTELAGQTTIE